MLSEKDLEYWRSGSGGCWLAAWGLAGSVDAFDWVRMGRAGGAGAGAGAGAVSSLNDGFLGGRGGGGLLDDVSDAKVLLSLASEAPTDPVLSALGGSVKLAGGTSSYDDFGSATGAIGLVMILAAGDDPGGGGGARRGCGDGAEAGEPPTAGTAYGAEPGAGSTKSS